MSMFPKRFVTATCPEYPDLKFKLLANPTGALYSALLEGSAVDNEKAALLGAALVEAYAGTVVEGYGATLDFSTPDRAIASVTDAALPVDLRTWLRNAPIDIVAWGREQIEKNYGASFTSGS